MCNYKVYCKLNAQIPHLIVVWARNCSCKASAIICDSQIFMSIAFRRIGIRLETSRESGHAREIGDLVLATISVYENRYVLRESRTCACACARARGRRGGEIVLIGSRC
jgi:hypothetical protein